MALVTETRILEGADIDFIVARDDAGVLSGFLSDGLSAADVKVFETIDAEGTGVDLQTKMEGFTLSNGQNAFSVYGDQVVNIDDYVALRQRQLYKANPAKYIADHEQRVATLEAAP